MSDPAQLRALAREAQARVQQCPACTDKFCHDPSHALFETLAAALEQAAGEIERLLRYVDEVAPFVLHHAEDGVGHTPPEWLVQATKDIAALADGKEALCPCLRIASEDDERVCGTCRALRFYGNHNDHAPNCEHCKEAQG